MHTIGIDEAGRGSLIGPLVVAGVYAGANELRIFRKLGVRDSKALTPGKREILFSALEEHNTLFHVVEISPSEIDGCSLNELELCAAAEIARTIDRPEARIVLDVPAFGKGIERYCKKLQEKLFRKETVIIGGNRMESKNLAVAAASIIAKVVRDRKIEQLKNRYGDFGSGYPNERTVAYVRANYQTIEPIVRKKWKTLKTMKHET